MVVLRPVQIVRTPSPGAERRVNAEILPRGGPRQQPQQAGRVLQRRHHFLDAGQRDMYFRQGLGQIAIALVGHDHAAAGFGNQEIGAGDADVRRQEPLPQFAPRLRQNVPPLGKHPVRRQIRVRQAELCLPILAVQVKRRGDDMARRLVPQLDDILAQIRLDRLDSGGLQMRIDAELFRDHGLALGHRPRPGILTNLQHRRPRVIGRAAPMHLPTGRQHVRLERLQIEIEVRQRMILDVPPDVAQPLELRQPRHGGTTARHELRLTELQRLLQRRIGQRLMGVLLEGGRRGDHGRNPPPPNLA